MAQVPPLSPGDFGASSAPGNGWSADAQANAPAPQRSELEPELGGILRGGRDRTGLEPELGSALRQRGVYVDEITCVGCRHCSHVARNTFFMEPDYGRARVARQDGDSEELIQEAIDTCPVDCIHWLQYSDLRDAEEARKDQVIPTAGFPVAKGKLTSGQRKRKAVRKKKRSS